MTGSSTYKSGRVLSTQVAGLNVVYEEEFGPSLKELTLVRGALAKDPRLPCWVMLFPESFDEDFNPRVDLSDDDDWDWDGDE